MTHKRNQSFSSPRVCGIGIFLAKKLAMVRVEFCLRLFASLAFVILSLVFIYYVKAKRPTSVRSPMDHMLPVYNERWNVCMDHSLIHPGTPNIFAITPTYSGPQQIPDLLLLYHTLSKVAHLHWIISEDAVNCSSKVVNFLNRWPDLSFTLLASPTPEIYKMPASIEHFGMPTGISGRRSGLRFALQLKNRSRTFMNGHKDVILFADPNFTLDPKLFEDIREVRGIGMFPVASVDPPGISSPVVDEDGKVIGFMTTGQSLKGRRFPIGLSGFAVATTLVSQKRPQMAYRTTWEGESFLRSLEIKYEDIEPLANNCTDIYVWKRARTDSPPKKFLGLNPGLDHNANVKKLFHRLFADGIAMQSDETNIDDDHDDDDSNKILFCLENNCDF